MASPLVLLLSCFKTHLKFRLSSISLQHIMRRIAEMFESGHNNGIIDVVEEFRSVGRIIELGSIQNGLLSQ